jgi:O-antigen/teichoic acid export membrane protein
MSEQISLRSRAVSGLKWNYAGSAARAVSSFAVGIVLARLLGPKPFGEIAIATLVIGFGNLVADFGFSAALIQQKDLTQRDIRHSFTVQVVVGVAFTITCAIFAKYIAEIFHQPKVASIIAVLGMMFLFQGLGQTAAGLLKRNLDFKSSQLSQIVSYIVGYIGIGIPLAYFGKGVWSLVFAQLSQTMINTILVYVACPHAIVPVIRHDGSLARYGIKILGANVLNWITFNFDTVLAGRAFPMFELGFYNRAFTLATTPVTSFVTVIQNVLFSSVSRAQDRPSAYRSAYLASISIVGVAMFPLYAGVAATPKSVMVGLYGMKWENAGALLGVFAIAMCFHAAMAVAGPLLCAINRVERELRAQSVATASALVVFPICAMQSLNTLAWGVLVIYGLRFALMTNSVLREIDLTWMQVCHELRGAVLLALCTGLSERELEHLLLSARLDAPLRLAVEFASGIVIVTASIIAAPSLVFGAEAIRLLGSLKDDAPSFLRWFAAICSQRHFGARI